MVLITTLRLMRDIYFVLMEASPEGFNMERMHADMLNVIGVVDVHDVSR